MRKFTRIASLLVTISMLLPPICAYAEQYRPSEWATESVSTAQHYGLVSSNSSTLPYNQSITRLEFCTFALNYYKLLKNPPEKTTFSTSFLDTDDKNILYAADLGIITGRGNGIFSPDDAITRQETSVIIVRLLSLCGTATTVSGADVVAALSSYTDTANLSDWAITPMAFCLENGIIKGMSENELWPAYHTTREQAIVTLLRCFELYAPVSAKQQTPVSSGVAALPNANDDYTNLTAAASGALTLVKYNDRSLTLSFAPFANAERYKIDIYLDQSNFWYSDSDTYVKTLFSASPTFTLDNVRIDKKYKINIYADDTDNAISGSAYVAPKFTLAQKEKIVFADGEITSKEQADALMRKITVNVWRVNNSGTKYASTATLEVHKSIADVTKAAFEEIFSNNEAFPIKDVGAYAWRDTMASGRYSHHNYGTAIDINYDENYCLYKDGSFIGSFYKPGESIYSIAPDSAVVSIFSKYGFIWGGDEWSNPKDYMHFSYLEL